MINLIKQGNSLVITSDQDFPFEAGKIVVPQNSLTYVIDESDIVCFRSVSNYDILFTGLLKDITINGTQATKDNLIQLFDAVGNAPMGADPEHSVTSVNGQVGDVTITAGDLNAYTKEEIDNKHFLTKIVLTQQEYDALPTKDPDVIYIISDAPETATQDWVNEQNFLKEVPAEYITESELLAKDYATKGELNSKQDTLVSGQNIKTINNQDITGSGNIEITVPEITVDAELSETSENPVQNKILTTELNKKTESRKLTQQEYNQLTPEEKQLNILYIITDAPEIEDNVFDASELYTAYLSDSKEVTPEFKDAILAAIPQKKVMVIHTSGNTATSDNNMVVNAASSELLTEFTGIFNDNLVAFTLDKNTNKVDMVVTPIGGGKSTKYINDEGASIFDLTTASSNAQIKTAFTSTDGIKIPSVGDEIIVNDIDNNIVNSGIVVSKTKNNDDYEIIIHSNNIVSGFISIDTMTVYYLESQGVDSLRVKRAEHSSINPALITEEAISALTGQVQNASKVIEITQSEYDQLPTKDSKTLYVISDAPEINVNDFATNASVDEKINAAIAGVEAKITEINNKI